MKRLLATLLLALPAAAHDFWIEPTTFRPRNGAVVGLHLRVGEHFEGDPVGRRPDLIERFALVTSAGEREVPGREGEDPAGVVWIEEGSGAIVVYRSRGSFLELDEEKFAQFLREEGVEWLRAERVRRGEADRPWREMFSRCAKSLLGDGSASLFQRRVGLRLELVPEALPSRGAFPVRLEFEGKPLRDALVIAISAGDPSRRVEKRTDRNGRAVLALNNDGVWLVKAVHVVRAPENGEAEWESLWGSLTFEISATSPQPRSASE